MNKVEEKEKFYSYLRDCYDIQVYSDDDLDKMINPIIHNLVKFEEPDMYSIVGEDLFIVEHFEFDSYNSHKKGSDYRCKEGMINNNFNKLLNENREKEITYDATIKSTASVNNYIDNFMKEYSKHYKKIPAYVERTKQLCNGSIKTCFFVEDNSPLGSYYFDEKRFPRLLFIFQFKKIVTFLNTHKEIYAIFYGYFDGNKKRLLVLKNSEESIDKFIGDHGYADDLECYWIEPNIHAFSIPVLKIEQ